jgi:hypothetical protein
MTDVRNLTADDCLAHLHDRFRIDTGDGQFVAAQLIEVQRRDAPGNGDRQGFALLFRGPADAPLSQRIYRLSAEGFGPLELFLVPVGTDAEGRLYEAVLS